MVFLTENNTICRHEAGAMDTIWNIISEFNPDLVVELGTFNGGFTELLQAVTHENVEIYSYDRISYPLKSIFRSNVTFVIADILSEPHPDIVRLCKSKPRKLLYCDNGNKIREFELYATHLNEDDLLGVHDWGKEIRYSDVEEVLVNFTPHNHGVFEDNNWSTRFFTKGAN